MSPELIAHYRIGSKLGEGGMGAVYRASDTKLNREVAIKVLPPAFAEDAARMQRFEREAQVLASLNHPNVAAIYGIEQGAIVMELVEGADLKSPVSIDTAIAYARQIAAGLEAAHEKGIIHRDLKPANIKVTPDGTVKLLDFGLAKATEASPTSSNATQSPTVSLAMTQAGMILGTAAYMAPEQARGTAVDKRADIWAFGVVLFEMLTGKQLFAGGETVTDIIAAVVTRDPDWKLLPADTPAHVRRLLERCLRKDPRQRLRDIGDARLALDEAEAPAPDGQPQARRAWLPWSVAAALALVLAASAWWQRPKSATGSGPGATAFLVPFPAGTNARFAGIAGPQVVPSPDGRSLVFVAHDPAADTEHLWVRNLASTEVRRLDQTEGGRYPFWSPDGQSIGFFTATHVKRVPVSGGGARVVCAIDESGAGKIGNGGTWSRDGAIVFGSEQNAPLRRVPAAGGVAVPVTSVAEGELTHLSPQFLPDGRRVIFAARNVNPAENGIYIQDLSSGKRTLVLKNPTRGAWTPPGYLLFVRDSALMAQRMDLETYRLSGEPVTVANDVTSNAIFARSAFAASENGVLAYQPGGSLDGPQNLAWYSRDGKRIGTVGKPDRFSALTLSPDGRSVALLAGPLDKLDLWVMDLATGVMSRLTSDGRGSVSGRPSWSPDSRRLALSLNGGGVREIDVASGRTTALHPECFVVEDWLPDGRSLLCNAGQGTQLSLVAPAPVSESGAKPQILGGAPVPGYFLRISPDGKYVAYQTTESGGFPIYVASFPSFAQKRRVSPDSGASPEWTDGGREICYIALGKGLVCAAIRTSPEFAAGTPVPVLPGVIGPSMRFAITAAGTRFLVTEAAIRDEANLGGMMVLLNWAAEIKE